MELVGDSELIVRQVKGEYKVKDATMRELHAEVKRALGGFERWSIRHVRREENAEADRLVNAALDGAGSTAVTAGKPTRSTPASTSATSTSRWPTSTARSTSTAACSASSCSSGSATRRPSSRPAATTTTSASTPGTAGRLAAARGQHRPLPPRDPLPDPRALADALRRLTEAGIPLDGASDHGVSEALYLRDPDGNGVELYWDRPREEWPRHAPRAGRRDGHRAARPARPARRAGLSRAKLPRWFCLDGAPIGLGDRGGCSSAG